MLRLTTVSSIIKEFHRYPQLSPEELLIREPWWHKNVEESAETTDMQDSTTDDEDFMDDNEWAGSMEQSALVDMVSEATDLVSDILDEFIFSYDSELELMIQDIEQALAEDTTLTASERAELQGDLEMLRRMVGGDPEYAELYDEIKLIARIVDDYEEALLEGDE